MQRTLEDEENGVVSGASGRKKQLAEEHSNNDVKTGMATTVQKHDDGDQIQASSNEASVIEKHDPDKKCEEHRNTQEVDQVQTSANETSVILLILQVKNAEMHMKQIKFKLQPTKIVSLRSITLILEVKNPKRHMTLAAVVNLLCTYTTVLLWNYGTECFEF
ncbi:hypothetical protein HN51_059964 [Arachis hypogaea]|nr:uncharacterized protein LOC114926155 [Arachis hypogaea]QHN83490.1 myosin-11 isoform [Arachis hypogaea]